MKKVKVIQDPEQPVEKEVLAQAIIKISEASDALSRSGVNRRGVVALIHDYTKLNKGVIEAVLEALRDLRATYAK